MEKHNFWEKIQKPIFALAPLASVTDEAFRRIIAKYGKPDVMFTEFVSTDGLLSLGRDAVLVDLLYSETERPIVAQLFGATPEHFYRCALLVQELGFDGIDINMGCPERNAVKQGSCAALIENPDLAQKIISETKRGAGNLPVSVKTRIGFNTIKTQSWIAHLLECGLSALIIHGRTKKEMSRVPAHWDEIGKAVNLRDTLRTDTIIIGNGDIHSLHDAMEHVAQYGVDGVMLGRAALGNPWLFSRKDEVKKASNTPSTSNDVKISSWMLFLQKHGILKAEKFWLKTKMNGFVPTPDQKLAVLSEHISLFCELFDGKKNSSTMKKHFKAYVNGFPHAKELRIELMACDTPSDVKKVLNNFKG